MGGTFSNPASMSDVLSKSDFPDGASYRLSDLGKITPGVTDTGGSYRLSDFGLQFRRFGDVYPYKYDYDNGNTYDGFDMTGTQEVRRLQDVQNDNLDINILSLRAVLTFDETTEGIIFESGGSGVGCALYTDSGTLYWQAGDGSVAGGTMELSTSISGFSLGTREIVITTDFTNNNIIGTMSVDGTQVDSVNTTGNPGNIAGSDKGGSGRSYDTVAVLRNNQTGAFESDNGIIHSIRIYNQ